MADPRFYRRGEPVALGRLAEAIGARLADPDRAGQAIADVGTLEEAGPEALSFLHNPKYAEALATTRAGACVVGRAPPERPAGLALLLAEDAYGAFARAAALFYPDIGDHGMPVEPGPGRVDPSARLGEGVVLGANAVVQAAAEIGEGAVVGPGAVIGPGTVLGAGCRIGANAVIVYAVLGARVTVQSGAVIGEAGFGFAAGAGGARPVPQLGRVLIGDAVHIGANTTIHRGSLGDTVIGAGTIIDNLVQIGHNVRIGRGAVLVAQTGISGSVIIEDGAMLGGQAGVAGHLRIGRHARVSAQSGIFRDVPDGETVFGSPAMKAKEFWRRYAKWRRS